MAKEEKLSPEDEENDELEEGKEKETEKSESPIKKYGLYAGIVVVMLVAAFAVTSFVVKPMLGGGESQTEVTATDGNAEHQEAGEHAAVAEESSSHDSEHGDGYGGAFSAADDIFLVSDLIVNPAGTGGTRFLSTTVGIEATSADARNKLENREVVVRDALIGILSTQSVSELSDFKQRERLRKLIQLSLQKLLDTKDIDQVYFTEFVLQ